MEGNIMKLFTIIHGFVCSLLLMGCYSYTTLSRQEGRALLQSNNADIRITTVDGSIIEVKSQHYITVRQPSDFVYAIGMVQDPRSGRMPFYGMVRNEGYTLKDTVIPFGGYELGKGPVYRLVTDNGLPVWAAPENVFFVKAHDAAGISFSGNVLSDEARDAPVQGRIPFEEIASIEEHQFSYLKTVPLAIGGAIVAASLVYGLAGGGDSWDWNIQSSGY